MEAPPSSRISGPVLSNVLVCDIGPGRSWNNVGTVSRPKTLNRQSRARVAKHQGYVPGNDWQRGYGWFQRNILVFSC